MKSTRHFSFSRFGLEEMGGFVVHKYDLIVISKIIPYNSVIRYTSICVYIKIKSVQRQIFEHNKQFISVKKINMT